MNIHDQDERQLTAWQEEHVLEEGGEHVPRFKVQERADQVKPICAEQ